MYPGSPFAAIICALACLSACDGNSARSGLNDELLKAAEEGDVEALKKALASGAQVNRRGFSIVPTFFINDLRIVGAPPFSEIQPIIEQELKK